MTPVEEIRESNAQWVDWAKRRAATFVGAEVLNLPGLIVAWGGSPIWLCNSIFLSRPVKSAEDLDEAVAALAGFLRDKNDPPFVVVCQEWIPVTLRAHAERALAAQGLQRRVTSAGMAAERLAPPASRQPALEYRRISDEETRVLAADINSAAHGFPAEGGRNAMGRQQDWQTDLLGYIAYADSAPVATCAALPLNGCIHVLRLATLPGEQRRGYGEAVMRRAVEAASEATGIERTTLHSTAASNALYRRMGYRQVAEFAGYGR